MAPTGFLEHRARQGVDHMVSFRTSFALVVAFAFAGGVTAAAAGEPVVTVTASRAACEGTSSSDSKRLAREAEKRGDYEAASKCFLAAGEYTRAHRASAHAAEDAAEVAKREASAAAESARHQMARIRAAFR
jgi:hypothetical protein